ncbi:MAG TPA: T9SS type A sorting domain-containing protein, partial [Bacteroidales bacterium]|nr:T9SS type A sorting domain-containing protein [Bacteroidales bacterium]
LLLFAVLLVTLNSEAQDFWEVLPFPESTDIYCTAVNNEGDIFVGAANDGAPGGVYRSLDNGQTWSLVLDLGEFSVISLEISNNGNIYAGTNWVNPLYVSLNNGETWEALPLPLSHNVVCILSIGSDTLFVGQPDVPGAVLSRSIDGGQTWETVFTTNDHSSECINDIIITPSGTMYIGLSGYFPGMGGVYRAVDNGNTWEFIGLFDCMITSLATNSAGDLFASSWGGTSLNNAGVYALRNGQQDWDTLTGGQISDMVINSEGHIYCSSAWPDGVIRSLDNGASFQLIDSGIPSSPMGDLAIDNLEYIYVTAHYGSNFLAKSVGPTVSVTEPDNKATVNLLIYPDPASDFLNICIDACMVEHVIMISVHDITCKTVYVSRTPLDSSGFRLPVSDLPAGLYIVKLAFPNRILTSKFIKL